MSNNKKVFKLKALVTASDQFANHIPTEYYLTKDYESYEEAENAIPIQLKDLQDRWNHNVYSNRPDGFYLSIHEFVKLDFSTIKYNKYNK